MEMEKEYNTNKNYKLKFEEMLPEEKDTCVNIATSAFSDYEYFSNYIPDKERRYKFIKNAVDVEYTVSKKNSIIFTAKKDNKIVATSILRKPNCSRASTWEYFKSGFGKGFMYGGFIDVFNWSIMEEKASQPCHTLKKYAWYLNLITVSNECRGLGIGSEMLKECIIPYVKEHGGKEICLFTNSDTNRDFYKQNGFSEFHEQYFNYRSHRLGSWSYSLVL